MSRRPRRGRSALVALALCLVVAGKGVASAPAAPTQLRRPSSPLSRACPGQRLTCAQLVALGLAYPYAREPGSYLFVDGVAYPYVRLGHGALADARVRAGDTVLTARALLERLGLGRAARVPRTPVIGYGSNANVDALTRKFVDSDFAGPAVVPVVEATLHDFDVAWSPQFVFNGAMPATIVSSPGTSVSVWITWLDAREIHRMNATEGVGTLYSYGFLTGARLEAPGPAVVRPGVYVDCFGALEVGGRVVAISGVPARHRRFPATASRGALRRVAPAIGWRGSVFGLLLDNVRSPARSARRSRALEVLAIHPRDPGYTPTRPCAGG